jgi:hypothetical protein
MPLMPLLTFFIITFAFAFDYFFRHFDFRLLMPFHFFFDAFHFRRARERRRAAPARSACALAHAERIVRFFIRFHIAYFFHFADFAISAFAIIFDDYATFSPLFAYAIDAFHDYAFADAIFAAFHYDIIFTLAFDIYAISLR